jgi:hypothetical protein
MRIDSSGNVGIGTSSPNFILEARSSGSTTIAVGSSGATSLFRGFSINDGITEYASFKQKFNDGEVRITAGLSGWGGFTTFHTNGGERMRIDISGNVGIGTTTPAQRLHLVASDPKLQLTRTSDFYYGLLSADGFSAFTNTNGNAPVIFKTANTEAMRIDSSGNVGIGTSSPATALHVASGDIRLTNGATFTSSNSLIREFSAAAGSSNQFVTSSIGFRTGAFVDEGLITFSTALNASTPTERMRIDASGNLLVGTTGAVSTTGLTISSPSLNGVFSSAESASATNHYRFYNPNGVVGGISTSGSATTYATSSDYRLKEDVQPMVGASDRLMALKPVNFAWKADGTRVDGFLAHEAQEVVKEAVTGEKDAVDKDGKPQYQGIDQSKLVPLLTAALQEALTEIADLKARVAALEA